MSPAGIGIAAVVYNYNGYVYASDESRMLAEMGDEHFRLGHVQRQSYKDIFLSQTCSGPWKIRSLTAILCVTTVLSSHTAELIQYSIGPCIKITSD